MSPDKCEHHQELAISVAEIRKDVSYIKDQINNKWGEFVEHINQSIPHRDKIRDNSVFIKQQEHINKMHSRLIWTLVLIVTAIHGMSLISYVMRVV